MKSLIRLQEKERVFKGEITAFLTLIFILMLSLVAALVESASIQTTKNRKKADMILALESTFAEYHRDMLDKYDLFVRHGCQEQQIRNRLEYYGATNENHSIMRKELLSDNHGDILYEQAVRYEKSWLGIEELPEETTDEDTTSEVVEENTNNEENTNLPVENTVSDETVENSTDIGNEEETSEEENNATEENVDETIEKLRDVLE